jgi:hypothetical protein
MRNINKIISFVLVLAMLMSMGSVLTVSAAAGLVEDTDVYTKNVDKLSAFGFWLYGAGVDDAGTTVTRGEFAEMLVRAIGMENLEGSGRVVFRDVPSSHTYFEAITVLYDLGVVAGEPGAIYRPDDIITCNEAIKLLVCVMGYETDAKELGVYPTGYLLSARRSGILVDGISGEENLTRGTVAEILANAVDVAIKQKLVYGTTMLVFSTDENRTILSEYHNIYKIYGAITAVGLTRIDDGVRLKDGKVEILDDGKRVVFNQGSTNAGAYVGYSAYAYYKQVDASDRDGNTLKYIDPVRNDVYVIENEYISSYSTSDGRLYYYTNLEAARTTHIQLSTNNIIFNKVKADDYSKADIENADRIIAIDNNADGIIDVTFVENEEVVMVKSISTQDELIYDNYRAGGIYDISNDGTHKITQIVDIYGNAVDTSSISYGTVLNVLQSKDKSVTTMVVTNQTVSGTVSEKINEGDKDYFVINGTTYELAKNKDVIADIDTVKVGGSYTFYLDKNNKIAGMGNASSTALVYGFLVAATPLDEMDATLQVRIYTTNKEFLETTLAKNCTINGKKNLEGDDAIREFFRVGSDVAIDLSRSSNIIGMGIKYSTNANGEINKIITPDNDKATTDEEYFALSTDEKEMVRFPMNGNPMYLRNPTIFDGRFRVNSNTKVFLVPKITVEESSTQVKPDKLSAVTIRDFKDVDNFAMGNTDSYKSWAGAREDENAFYDLNAERYAGMAVKQRNNNDEFKVTSGTGITILTKITQAQDENGELYYKLYGLRKGTEVSMKLMENPTLYDVETLDNGTIVLKRVYIHEYRIDDDNVYPNAHYIQTVGPGDMVRLVTNDAGELFDYEKTLDLKIEDNVPLEDNAGNQILVNGSPVVMYDDPEVMKRFRYASRPKDELELNENGEWTDSNSMSKLMKQNYAMISLAKDADGNYIYGKDVTDKEGNKTGEQHYTLVYHGSNEFYFYGINFKLYYVTVDDIVGDTVIYTIHPAMEGISSAKTEIGKLSGFKVTIIDQSSGELKIRSGNQSDITPKSVVADPADATECLMYLSNGSPSEIFIFR